jgi:hypothetical protein
MRTTKRFTPKVLERFKRLGRGQGTYADYTPWHRVGRSDPSSQGRSHLQVWANRHYELLSDQEWVALFFAMMVRGLHDIREQFPLSLTDGPHELAAYRADTPSMVFSGTLALAQRLGIKHPKVTGNGGATDWIMTTDLLIAIRKSDSSLELIAISIKPKDGWQKKRTYNLLQLEKTYWEERGITWLLITPEVYDPRIPLTLRCTMPWALGAIVKNEDRYIAAQVTQQSSGHPLTHILKQLAVKLGGNENLDYAQRAFWQAAWAGVIKLDFRRGWRPHIPPMLLSDEAFKDLNPIACRRSSWI